MKSKVVKIIMIFLIIIIAIIGICILNIKKNNTNNNEELISISSKKELEDIYDNNTVGKKSLLEKFFKVPYQYYLVLTSPLHTYSSSINDTELSTDTMRSSSGAIEPANIQSKGSSSSSTTNNSEIIKSAKEADYSTTNIQVENVDEADVTKTDGNYIYSISGENVIITDVREPENTKISSKILTSDSSVPEELILYKNKLVIISSQTNKETTIVKIYNIENKEKPNKEKQYTLYQSYYTSRSIDGKLYLFATGSLKKDKEQNDIITYFKEENTKKVIQLKDIKYLKDKKTKDQTLIATIDLENPNKDINVKSYLMDLNNAYISEDNIYLLDNTSEYKIKYTKRNFFENIAIVFSKNGAFDAIGQMKNQHNMYNKIYNKYTKIYKFKILENGEVTYSNKQEIEGSTINQFSLDEYKGNLRIALNENKKGTRVVIFDKDLKQIGATDYLAPGESMYSSRFLGDKAYLVTYQTIDPLFVLDLSNPTKPKVLGELKIPGYSSYLHPYDENHIIGIGMQTEEKIIRDISGKVQSRTAIITGMKMALFDVSDVNNPQQISETIIGDRRTTSAILTNHKALLFSKEKQLIAIPVNNYSQDFEIETNSNNNIEILEKIYTGYNSKNVVSEGYLVYNINANEGFKLKGNILHEAKYKSISNYNTTRLLRGLYIKDNLFTISEDQIKVNNLNNLNLIKQVKIN